MFARRTDWKLQENAYTLALRRRQRTGRPILDLTISNPTACGFEYDEAAILAAFRTTRALRYDPDPQGLASARAAVAQYYAAMNPAIPIDPAKIILTTGTSEAYSFLFRLLCEPGDNIVIAQPSYPLFEFLATIHDVNLHPFQLIYDHGWLIDFQALQQAINSQTRAILLVHPNNPTGHFIRPTEADQLRTICAERRLALVADEVFLDYRIPDVATAPKHQGSFATDGPALTFVLSGLSKISALPQMKLGWIVAGGPDALVRQALERLEVISDTYLSLSAPLQYALPALLAQRAKMQPQLMDRIRQNLVRLDRWLVGQKLTSRLQMEGGWYAVLRVPAVESDDALAIRLVEQHGVAVQPGHFYEFPGHPHLVLSLLTPTQMFEKGIAGLLACVAG